MPDQDFKLITIFSGTHWEAMMVQSLLENAEIQAFLKDVSFSSLNSTPIGDNSVKVIISSEDYASAKQVVDEYYSNLSKADDEP